MSKHNLKFIDFEVYPDWWCLVVSDERDTYPGGMGKNEFTQADELAIKNDMRVYRSDMADPETLRRIVRNELIKGVLCGYNIKRYDLIIAKCIIAGFAPRKVRIASEILIDDGKTGVANKDAEHMRIASYIKWGFNEGEAYQDLMDDSDKTLKDKECSLGMDIRETTVPFDKTDLTEEEKQEIIFYCKHDVYALHVYYWCVAQGYISTKIDLCKAFDLPIKVGYVNTNANLCGKVLKAERVHGTTIVNPTIVIRDKGIAEYFKKWIPEDIYQHLLTSQRSRKAIIYNNIVTMGDGGLHSEYFFEDVARSLGAPKINGIIPDDSALKKIFGREAEVVDGKKKAATTGSYAKYKPALYIESNDEWTMYNIDASSCYASVMMYCDAMSRAIKDPKRLKEIYDRRIKLKMTPKSEWTTDDKIFVGAGKLVLNTTYGAMGNKWLSLYDDYMRSKTCRVGQMILIAIANHLFTEITDIKIIQNNTDGILVYARRTDLPKIQTIVDEFSAISNFVFEVEEDNRLWQLNVNNYIAEHPDKSIKNKGGAFVMSVYQPGYNKLRPFGNFVIPRAQIAFYTTGANPVLELLNNTNVEDFCLTATKGPGYRKLIQHNKDGDIELGRVSRVIAVTDKRLGVLVKTKHLATGLKEDTVALCPQHSLVLNDALYNYSIKNRKIYHVDGRSWDIDYTYYARELDKALDTKWYKLVGLELKTTNEFNL